MLAATSCFDRVGLPKIQRQALRRGLVLREVPDAPERRLRRIEASLRPLRRREMPALLGDLRRIAHRDRPRRGRVEDQCRLTRNQRLVVARIVPGIDFGRQERRQPLEVIEHLFHRVGLDGDVAVLIGEFGAVGVEDRADPVGAVAGLTDGQTERMTGLEAFLRRLQEEIPGPLVDQFLVRGAAFVGIHLGQVEADGFLEDVDASDRGQGQRVGDCRRGDPVAVLLADIGHRCGGRAVTLDQLGPDVVGVFELGGMGRPVPARQGDHVVTGLRLRLGRRCDHQLVALAGDVVDLDLDLFLRPPLVAQLGHRVVGAGNPMVPESHRHAARGIRAVHKGQRQRARRRHDGGGFQHAAPGHLVTHASSQLSGPVVPANVLPEPAETARILSLRCRNASDVFNLNASR